MPSHVTLLLSRVDAERKAVNAVTGPQVQSKSHKERIRSLVEDYFNEVRPLLDDATVEGIHITSVDGLMQTLLQLCHKSSSTAKYKSTLKYLKKHLVLLDSWLIATPLRSTSETREGVDDRIVVTLRALRPSAALSYEQALVDLAQDQRLSWRGPATDLREALRETLDQLAPDEDVIAAPGFKQEKDTNGPTMKQKVRFVLKNRKVSKSIAATTEDATATVDEAVGAFVRSVYTRSSVSTHTPTSKDEAMRVLSL
ncbi:MAG: hypothetical protein WCF44_19765, partial [Candidatus Methylophosphatis roskildensis]